MAAAMNKANDVSLKDVFMAESFVKNVIIKYRLAFFVNEAYAEIAHARAVDYGTGKYVPSLLQRQCGG